ncbi:MAG: hypothetical protein ABJA98_29665 [Acidobacteriota bacterium]
MTGFIAVVSAVTALALRAVGSAHMRWFDAILPAGMVVAGAIVAAAARPIARAVADKH